MSVLAQDWPDPDRRDKALERILLTIAATTERGALTPMEIRVLTVMSHGPTENEAATLIGVSLETVKWHTKGARRALRAKNTTHAVAIALREGFIS